ncbi:hypothetical protein FHS31_000259 [Sphingomonas vulcanisoli]|uniref:Uncharacterized protein n=1 Tax=Sphingomonas vulcanisoli TaxID=1658060 RepID=A0ABX0TME1_9SPHN|nr:hypothetical protein [Sphingomonas vulcanisoli]
MPLAPGQSSNDVFRKIDPLFRERGTRHETSNDTLTFTKKDQAAQDKMSVFDSGILWVENRIAGSVMRYHLVSRALLFCFLAPLLFIGFAQLTIALYKPDKPAAEATAAKAKKTLAKDMAMPLNPIDKFLGAPEPDKPKDGKDKPAAGRNRKPSPTAAYVFASLFAILYVVGRILEDVLVKRLFMRTLAGAPVVTASDLHRPYQGTV